MIPSIHDRALASIDKYGLPPDELERFMGMDPQDPVTDYYGFTDVQAYQIALELGIKDPEPKPSALVLDGRNAASLAIALTRER